MADTIKCPICGEDNAAGQEFCQNCQWRLQPLTGPLKGADAPLRPGQPPINKATGELEPILPQWLRDARSQARESVDDDFQITQRQDHIPLPNDPEPDLLAGLRSQSRGNDEDDDTPDWLADITGLSPKSKKTDVESSDAHHVEMDGRNDFAYEESAPAWPAEEKDELKNWFNESSGLDAGSDQATPSASIGWPDQQPAEAGSFSNDQFDAPAPLSDVPDWLKQMSAEDNAKNAPASASPVWMGDESKNAVVPPLTESSSGGVEAGSFADGVPDWLQGLVAKASVEDAQPDDTWSRQSQAQMPAMPSESAPPMWMEDDRSATLPDAFSATLPESQPAAEDADFGDIPGWLKAAAPQSSVFADTPADETPVVPPEASSDWLSSFKSSEIASPPFSAEQTKESDSLPAFTADAFQAKNADALFTEMPDWLSGSAESAPASSPSALTSADSIAPGELPSWVQAMRPVDTGASRPTAASSSSETVEARGALAGLQGVLPAVPGYAPSSKPKAYSIKLQASDEQQSHAALLEQILAAETEPVPITSLSPLKTSRGLRWFLSFVIIASFTAVMSLRTQIFSMPVGAPNEFNGALVVAQNVPEDAPVLVVVDYHPARAGEMEAAAAPMFDQMMVLRHPRLTFISTNETGAILAERFLSGPLNGRGYQYGTQYLNLGYLAGGMAGIRAFAENPVQAMPFDTYLSDAWTLAPLQGVTSLSQFAALILITDNADSARAWIEQTTTARQITPFPFVVIASAQAAPMVQPYYDSNQISGVVSGLYGGAIFERNNAGRPGLARMYWDSYSIGMLLAVLLIVVGGLWSMALNVRDRAVKRDGR